MSGRIAAASSAAARSRPAAGRSIHARTHRLRSSAVARSHRRRSSAVARSHRRRSSASVVARAWTEVHA
ncbi:MAG: hypothetical protein KIT84_20700 [Labilithrix sp.]|nr:hypothetical protein [Labilithrix sp.]MCW5813461.1 hypothetical protein [Labilithrix sp.]